MKTPLQPKTCAGLRRGQRTIFRIVLAIVIGTLAVAYSEVEQKHLLRPLWERAAVPDGRVVPASGALARVYGVPLKPSREGYYINPHQLTSLVYNNAVAVLHSDACDLSNDARNKLLRISSALRDMGQHVANRGIIWPYPISFTYGLQPGWISGMAQARAAVVLRAGAVCATTESERAVFEVTALKALQVFYRTVEDGGVIVDFGENGVWLEEYAQPGIEPPMVLNGHIYAVIALRDINVSLQSEQVSKVIENAIAGLKNHLQLYDRGFWSMYDQAGTLANINYQVLHARQMEELWEWLRDPAFLEYAKRFKVQRANPVSPWLRLLIQPGRFLALLLAINVTAAFLVLTILSACVSRVVRRRRWHQGVDTGARSP